MHTTHDGSGYGPQETSAIVVGVDFDVESERALDEAIKLTLYRPDTQLHVVYADPSLAAIAMRTDVKGLAARAEATLAKLRELVYRRLAALGVDDDALVEHQVVAHFRVGTPAEEVVQLAVDVDADLVVVGTHGRRGVKRLVLGSVAAKILSHARCPVYVVRGKDHHGVGVVPNIEPPCAECVAVRKRSGGAEWWCERHHLSARVRPHHYSYVNRSPSAAPAPWGASFD
jgi:nucleotide-binding universal stress UspA family protein